MLGLGKSFGGLTFGRFRGILSFMNDVLTSPVPPLETIGLRLNAPPDDGPPDIIEGLLPREGELVIAGETNIGKSLLALEICSSLSTGLPLWGQLEPKLQARKILYILGEHYAAVIQRLLQVTQLPMADTAYIIAPQQIGMTDKFLVAAGHTNTQAIEKMKVWAEGCDLVVFDPLSAFVSGVDIENDNVQMRQTLDNMSYVAQSVGAACLVLAHQGKPMMDQQGVEKRRTTYAIRGASAIEDAATNIFYFSTAGEVKHDGGSLKTFDLTMRKYKGLAPSKYTLYRDPTRLTHSISLAGTPFTDNRKAQWREKIGRIQERHPHINHATAMSLVAATEGIPVGVIKNLLQGTN